MERCVLGAGRTALWTALIRPLEWSYGIIQGDSCNPIDDKSIEEGAGNTEIHVKSTNLIDVSLKSESGFGIKFVPLHHVFNENNHVTVIKIMFDTFIRKHKKAYMSFYGRWFHWFHHIMVLSSGILVLSPKIVVPVKSIPPC